ncbi:lipocalin family protein [Pseudomonas hormoni]|uniref:Outer membrane lipoprotein Blc n=1 Tax=Pseudomonas hormoni TaxID=3093767 RepID=A0ABX8EUG1_9PSED|nr:lipocalin family protein [Pseudomonas hormoni]QVW21923.1 lipocalin family protein [Pseudomonas hormoni]
MSMRTIALLSCLTLALAGCAGSSEEHPPATMHVDLQKYQGTWYEQARLPMFFQRNCEQSEAHYGLRDDGRIDVTNRCREKDGEWNEARGIAEAQQPGKTDKLWVQFDNWFSHIAPGVTKGQYWVLYHDPDYQFALVGHPNREYLWVLSRAPRINGARREQLLEVAKQQGYDTSKLIWRQADPAQP